MAEKKVTPSERLNALGDECICDHVAGGDSLLSWCNENNFAYNTVLAWIDADAERAANYARARDIRAEVTFERLDDVSDAAVRSESAVEVAGLRLKSDNIKWKLARMSPKYNDKIDHTITGANGGAIKHDVSVVISAEESYRRMLDEK